MTKRISMIFSALLAVAACLPQPWEFAQAANFGICGASQRSAPDDSSGQNMLLQIISNECLLPVTVFFCVWNSQTSQECNLVEGGQISPETEVSHLNPVVFGRQRDYNAGDKVIAWSARLDAESHPLRVKFQTCLGDGSPGDLARCEKLLIDGELGERVGLSKSQSRVTAMPFRQGCIFSRIESHAVTNNELSVMLYNRCEEKVVLHYCYSYSGSDCSMTGEKEYFVLQPYSPGQESNYDLDDKFLAGPIVQDNALLNFNATYCIGDEEVVAKCGRDAREGRAVPIF